MKRPNPQAILHSLLLLSTGVASACTQDDETSSSREPVSAGGSLFGPASQNLVSTELFISEYIEGSSNNKALEIYNGTTSAIDLTPYTLQFFFNGSTTAGTTIALQGTIAPGDVFVVADNDAAAAILAVADQTSTGSFYNGDDAIVLSNAGTVIDVIGQVGFDPGTEWTSPDGGTQDNTLRRDPSLQGGDPDGSNAFLPEEEWLGFGVDVFSDLGQHVVAAGDLFISEYIEGSSNNKALEIFNGTGGAVDLSAYTLQFFFNGGVTATTTITLAGTLADGDVFVVADNDAAAAILAVTDLTSTATFYNGDDAIVLSNAGVIIDVIGQVGFDPGTEWTGTNGGTQDNTLRRDPAIAEGDADGTNEFLPDDEWLGFGVDAFDGLGEHLGGGGETGETTAETTGGEEPTFALIHEVQGAGAASPLVGVLVTVEGVVVGDFQASNQLSGFFIQEENSDADTDPATSEGLFVFSSATDVAVGDVVRATGTVAEFFNLTELTSVSEVAILGSDSAPTPATIALPLAAVDSLEPFEGMGIVVPQTLFVTEHFNLGRFGEVLLSSQARLTQPTQVLDAGPQANALQAQNDLNQILLDDFSTIQNPDPVIYPAPELTADNTLRGGTTVAGLTGVLHFGFDVYRIQPTVTPAFDLTVNPRPEPPVRTGSLRVGAFNVLNFFNGDGQGGGFPTARGANTADELERQAAKIVSAIVGLDADILGLLEIENDGYGAESAIAELVARVNEAAPSGTTYSFVDPGLDIIGTDAIAVGFMFRTETVALTGASAILDSSVDPRFIDTLNRPTLAQTFTEIATGERMTLAVNHLKSKGSACDDVGDPDAGDLQGNCNGTRTAAAEALVDWLATDPTNSDDSDFVILGDLNSYAQEDPIQVLRSAGFEEVGPSDYSFAFDGQWGTLDYVLVTESLAAQLAGAEHWHINSDEPRVLDYNVEFKSANQIDLWFAPTPFRASDHDPLVADFSLDSVVGTPPTVDFLLPINGLPVPRSFAVAIDATDVEDVDSSLTVQIQIDGGAFLNVPFNSLLRLHAGLVRISARGSHTINARAIDSDGNVSALDSVTITVR